MGSLATWTRTGRSGNRRLLGPDGIAVYSAFMTKNRPDSASAGPNQPEATTAAYQVKQFRFRNPSEPQNPNKHRPTAALTNLWSPRIGPQRRR